MNRRRFLTLALAAPVVPLLAKLPMLAAAPEIITHYGDMLSYPVFTRETQAWTISAAGYWTRAMSRAEMLALTR